MKRKIKIIICFLLLTGCVLTHAGKYGTITVSMTADEVIALYTQTVSRDAWKYFAVSDGTVIKIDRTAGVTDGTGIVRLTAGDVRVMKGLADAGIYEYETAGIRIRIRK